MLITRRLLPAILATPALAQEARPIRLIIPFGPGGITDIVARIVAEAAAQVMGVPVVAENRPGANGNIAGEAVARAAPDGQTLLMASLAMFAVNPVIYPRMPFDPAADFALVTGAASTPHVLVTRPGLAEPRAAMRARAEAVSFGTAGAGSSPHLTMLALQRIADASLLAVHFRSGAASVQAVIAGQVDMTAEATPVVSEHIRAGSLRAICVAGAERLALLPDVPTAEQAGFAGLENGSTSGVVAPRGTPPAVLARLAQGFGAAVASSALRARLEAQGSVPLAPGADAFAALIAREVTRWRPLVQGLSPG